MGRSLLDHTIESNEIFLHASCLMQRLSLCPGVRLVFCPGLRLGFSLASVLSSPCLRSWLLPWPPSCPLPCLRLLVFCPASVVSSAFASVLSSAPRPSSLLPRVCSLFCPASVVSSAPPRLLVRPASGVAAMPWEERGPQPSCRRGSDSDALPTRPLRGRVKPNFPGGRDGQSRPPGRSTELGFARGQKIKLAGDTRATRHMRGDHFPSLGEGGGCRPAMAKNGLHA